MEAFTDSFKRFKTAFFKVSANPGQQPWFLHGAKGLDVEWKFPLFWQDEHYQKGPSSYLVGPEDLFPESISSASRLFAFVNEYGVQSVAFFITGEGSRSVPSNSTIALIFLHNLLPCLVIVTPVQIGRAHV